MLRVESMTVLGVGAGVLRAGVLRVESMAVLGVAC